MLLIEPLAALPEALFFSDTARMTREARFLSSRTPSLGRSIHPQRKAHPGGAGAAGVYIILRPRYAPPGATMHVRLLGNIPGDKAQVCFLISRKSRLWVADSDRLIVGQVQIPDQGNEARCPGWCAANWTEFKAARTRTALRMKQESAPSQLPLRFSRLYDGCAALQLLLIQGNQAIVQLIRQGYVH
jgi:hypothetical protein